MKHVYKEGDLIKVINPEFVIRVGYPLTLENALEHCEANFEKEAIEFCNKVRMRYLDFSGELVFNDTSIRDSKFYYEVMKSLASNHLRQVNFGGPERSLHTELEEQLRNTGPWRVEGKRRVKTGTYESGYTDYDGDYTPAYLGNEKTHTLLRISPEFQYPFGIFSGPWEIESTNVEIDK